MPDVTEMTSNPQQLQSQLVVEQDAVASWDSLREVRFFLVSMAESFHDFMFSRFHDFMKSCFHNFHDYTISRFLDFTISWFHDFTELILTLCMLVSLNMVLIPAISDCYLMLKNTYWSQLSLPKLPRIKHHERCSCCN